MTFPYSPGHLHLPSYPEADGNCIDFELIIAMTSPQAEMVCSVEVQCAEVAIQCAEVPCNHRVLLTRPHLQDLISHLQKMDAAMAKFESQIWRDS